MSILRGINNNLLHSRGLSSGVELSNRVAVFHSDGLTHRDQQSHNHYCDLVEGDVSGRGGFSTTYGVNNRSVLLDLPLFDVTKCLPFDIMHSLFEGVSTHLLNQLFHHLINDDILGLDEINQEIHQICLGYSDSMPAPVYRDGRSQSEFHFKQKASQMMTLVKFLPLAIGESIPEGDEHWSCFLVFWEICKISLAFEIREEDAGHLGWLVAIFLEMFSFLYSEGVNITPKMHHLVHLPDQILRFGPLRNTWCMRFESKNKEMKQYTSYCFKNVPLSVTIRHQQSLCYLLTVRPGTTVSSFLYPRDQVLGGSMCSVYEEIADDLAAAFRLNLDLVQ